MNYDYEILLEMCKDKNSELLEIPNSANNKFYIEEDFNEIFGYFWNNFKSICLNYSYEELKEQKKTVLIDLLSKALISEDDSPYLISITKGAIKRYVSIVSLYLQDTRKQRQAEYKANEARKKALKKILPNNMEGQELLDFVKDELEKMIQTELNATIIHNKPKKKEKSLKEDYEQLELNLVK